MISTFAVEAARKLIVEYMQQERQKADTLTDDYGDRPHHDLAASVCDDILTASGRDGHGGCFLCRS